MKTASLLSIAALSLATLGAAAHAEDYNRVALPDLRPALTRAEVQADLVLWQRAGLANVVDDSYTFFSDDYDRRVAQYQRWRQGPEFRAEVQRLGGSTVSAQGSSSTVQN